MRGEGSLNIDLTDTGVSPHIGSNRNEEKIIPASYVLIKTTNKKICLQLH